MHRFLIKTRCFTLSLLAVPLLHAQAAVVTDPPAPSLKLGHTAALTALAYSADGTTVVSLDASREVRWRYAATGAPQFLKKLSST